MRNFTLDAVKRRETKKASKAFKPNAAAERQFQKSLKQVAKASAHIVDAHVKGAEILNPQGMLKALSDYAKVLGPWARSQSARLLADVANKNKRAYEAKSRAIGTALKLGVAHSDVGETMASLMEEQVALIKSLPLEAGQRAQRLASRAVYTGQRSDAFVDQIAEDLKKTGEYTEARAVLIARTETARANASITQARASAIGATWYIWETTLDGAERHSHREMNGKAIRYDEPPTLSDGTRGHAGTFPNCRCWQNAQFGPFPG